MSEIILHLSSEELIDMFNAISVPISKTKTIPEVVSDPLVERRLLFSRDPITGTESTLAPPPYMTPFLKETNRQLSFPPRFGEHNQGLLRKLGYSESELQRLKEKKVI